MKKCIASILTVTMLGGTALCSCAGADSSTVETLANAKIIYDGQTLDFDTTPVNDDGTVFAPVRAVLEAFGAKVKWDGDTQTVTARKGSKTYTMTLGSDEITVSKDGETTDTVSANKDLMMINDRTMVPVRVWSELLGLDVEWQQDTESVIITTPSDDEDDSWKSNTGTVDLSTMTADGDGVSVSGKVITISKAGDFTVTGTSADAQIVVDAADDEKVKIRLSGASLTNSDGAAIYAKSVDKLYITAEDGTESTLSDGGEYSDDSETNACVYAKCDLEIKGSGTLNINGSVHHGISAKDDFKTDSATLNITSAADGIHVNDTAEIGGGTLNITSAQDGIQSESILDITDGTINITCTGDVTVSGEFGMGGRDAREWRGETVPTDAPSDGTDEEDGDESSKGLKAEWMLDISGGNITVNSNDTCVKADSEIDISGGTLTLTSEKKKGIKGMEDVNISGGTIDIKKSTEGIETKRILTIDGGDIDIIASDDGINAGGNMMGGGGEQPMLPDMFGDENDSDTAPQATADANGTQPQDAGGGMGGRRGGGGRMQGGEQPQNMPQATAGADGEQPQPPEAGGGQPGGGMGGGQMPGEAQSEDAEQSSEHHVQINGGDIYINSQGDGIDSNASIVIDGGTLTVDGPASGGDSALDHDGLFRINGGTVIAVGAAGMIENPADTSEQNVISAYTTASAGSVVTIKSSGGTEICSYTVNKDIGHIMFSSSDIESGETYTVYVDGTEAISGTIDSTVTIMGTATAENSADPGNMQQPGGGMGGGMQPGDGMGGGMQPDGGRGGNGNTQSDK